MMRTVWILPLVLGALLAGCGYSTQASLDARYRTIHVAPFLNRSGEYDFQAQLTNAVIRKFVHDGRLRVTRMDEADLLLEGAILDYRMRGLTYDRDDEVTQFLVLVTAGVRMTDLQTGDVLWEERLMSGESSFYTRASGQSSDRLRGNAEVFLSAVRSFSSEEENRGASEALEQLASDIFYRSIEPW